MQEDEEEGKRERRSKERVVEVGAVGIVRSELNLERCMLPTDCRYHSESVH